jgi:hypothetical protein
VKKFSGIFFQEREQGAFFFVLEKFFRCEIFLRGNFERNKKYFPSRKKEIFDFAIA